MALSVTRAKTAFQFFQAERLGEIKKELGPGTTMGTAMSELSERWKNLSEEGRAPFHAKETEDRKRFKRESAAADARAYAEQTARRNNLIAKEGEVPSERGARKRVADERAVLDATRRRRRAEIEAEMDPEELAERRRIKAQKKAETAERQRKRDEQERAVAERHKKIDKAEAQRATSRLEFLLKQSSIFSKLKMGHHEEENEEKKKGKDGKYVSHHRQQDGDRKGRPPAKKVAAKTGEEVDDDQDEEEETERHVFLTKQPSCIKFGTLKPYQLESLNWMIHLAEKGLNGILADEMGLGKTLQSISILAYNYEYLGIQGPHLVCVPKSTLSNWMNELNRWCPSLRAIRFHGNKDDREAIIREYFTNEAAAHDGKRPSKQVRNEETGEMEDDNSENPRAWDVCVTTYEVCNTERKTLEKFGWRYLIIDEAHRLKNEASMFSQTVRGFKTAYRLLLTGTPLQNNLHELWALLNFLLPDIFTSAEQFDEWFNLEIDDAEAKKGMISQLHKILRPFMIRRLKVDVAKGLPPKTETLIMVGMSRMQKALYKNLLLRDIESITGKTTSKNQTAVLNIVMQLRKCCGHPYLFEGVEDRTLEPLGEHLVENCGKLAIMDKLMKKLKERGSRVLIFTQMTRILDILEDFMFMRGYAYCRIDGNTDYEDRESAIDNFNKEGSEKFCFILSTRAGGLGINLQTADICILYDSDWNPQADLQAQDRCHRLGQKKPVSVYRLVTENTVEEKIVERAQQKLKLDAMVVQQGRLKEKDKVTKDEIMAAVRFGADTVFRSEESTITDDDIDVILERGKAKTAELAAKIQKADKGDLLDFSLDAGMSAQTFDGVDYSDRDMRNQLRLMAANSMGKRERRAPPTNYNPIMQPKKSMLVNNRKVKLPRVLRLPRMEDHQFYNRERLLELDKLEFETYAALREVGQLPPRDAIEAAGTLLDPELAAEKLDLLEEGFGNWTRSQYFNFVKACAKFGREDLPSIAAEMEIPLEDVTAYGVAFWKYGPAELKKDEWDRAVSNITKGEQKIAKKKKHTQLLQKFLLSFDNPRDEMTFANKGTAHFALEQDRALLAAVDKYGYGNWEAIREELRNDTRLQFQHAVLGMNQDMIGKRIDYRMRQMEKEVEAREKKLKSEKPANVVAAENAILAIKVSGLEERCLILMIPHLQTMNYD
uniref:Chromatin-remodeling complex ATPase chain n=1 Tax=Odontella aurita TaxID=265563 RepID=A0A7S4K713_9STRA|mmetsp:Transcript_63202/g.186803  ORF Transcript_63202/g.186803 Transcript_63202/m.186803 type:complete len:1171 (+) Transcript_63202:421-3933(+)